MATTKAVCDLVPGDVLPGKARTITKTETTATDLTATFDDGSTQTWPLAGKPAVEVVVPADAADVVGVVVAGG